MLESNKVKCTWNMYFVKYDTKHRQHNCYYCEWRVRLATGWSSSELGGEGCTFLAFFTFTLDPVGT